MLLRYGDRIAVFESKLGWIEPEGPAQPPNTGDNGYVKSGYVKSGYLKAAATVTGNQYVKAGYAKQGYFK